MAKVVAGSTAAFTPATFAAKARRLLESVERGDPDRPRGEAAGARFALQGQRPQSLGHAAPGDRADRAARENGQASRPISIRTSPSSTSLEATLLPTWCREGGRKEIERPLGGSGRRGKIRARGIAKSWKGTCACRSPATIRERRMDRPQRGRDRRGARSGREADVVLEMEDHGGARES